MRFRPCIDLHEGLVKQIVGGTLTADGAETNFVADRDGAYFAGLYRERGLSGGHVVMLGPGNETAALKALAAYPGGLQLGGGVDAGNAGRWLDGGADKVIVTSFVFRGGQLDESRLDAMLKAVGRDKLVLDLSCRKRGGDYFIVTDRWQKFTDMKLGREVLEHLGKSAAEFLVHAVDVEGRQAGVDSELLNLLGEFSPIPVTYAGGVASLADVETVRSCGRNRVDYTIGSALDIFGGRLSFDEVCRVSER